MVSKTKETSSVIERDEQSMQIPKNGGNGKRIVIGDEQNQLKAGYLDKIPTPVMAIDKDFNVKYMNPAGAQVVGRTPETCIGQKCFNLFNTHHCNTADCQVGKAIREDKACTSDTIARLPSGELPIRYTGTPLKDEQGNIIGGLEYVLDITQEKIAKVEAETKIDYLNKIPTPVMVVDKEFNVKFMNPAGAQAVGRTPETCIGQKCYSLFNTLHCNTADCQVGKAMRENGIFTNDTIARLPSGELPIRYTGAPLKDEQGNIIGGLEYVLDITAEIQSVNGVLNLVASATEGKLNERADISQYVGNFKKIIAGINDLLNAVVNPINEAADVLSAMANKDFTQNMNGDYKGDFANMKKSVNAVIHNLGKLIGQVKENAASVAGASQQLHNAAEQAGSATNQIASVSQQVAKGAEEQTRSVDEVKNALNDLDKAILQVTNGSSEQSKSVIEATNLVQQVHKAIELSAQNAQAAANNAEQATNNAKDGAEKVESTITGMTKIDSAMKDVTDKITLLGQHSDEIGKMIAVIDDIAAQTNLLALNAAIEAARAGEQGRGFAVVADEVKKLAERTAKETQDIANLVGAVQKGVSESIKSANEGSKQTEEGNKLANEAGNALNQIMEASRSLLEQIEQMSAASEQISASASDVVKVIDNLSTVAEQNSAASEQMMSNKTQLGDSTNTVASITEENSASTEELSASAEEMSAQVEEVVASAQSLSAMAIELQSLVDTFKIDGAANSGNENDEALDSISLKC